MRKLEKLVNRVRRVEHATRERLERARLARLDSRMQFTQDSIPSSSCLFRRLGAPFDAPHDMVEDAYAIVTANPRLTPSDRALVDEAYQTLTNAAERELYVMTYRTLLERGLVPPLVRFEPACSRLTKALNRIHDYFRG